MHFFFTAVDCQLHWQGLTLRFESKPIAAGWFIDPINAFYSDNMNFVPAVIGANYQEEFNFTVAIWALRRNQYRICNWSNGYQLAGSKRTLSSPWQECRLCRINRSAGEKYLKLVLGGIRTCSIIVNCCFMWQTYFFGNCFI